MNYILIFNNKSLINYTLMFNINLIDYILIFNSISLIEYI